MTLIVALRCGEGVILGSDSQETRGTAGRRLGRATRKIYVARDGFLVAWAGAQDVAQAFVLQVRRAEELSAGDDRLEVRRRLHEILAALRSDPAIAGRSDHLEVLVAWWSRPESRPVALHMLSGGASEWVSGWAFGGVALGVERASFATGGLGYADPGAMGLEPGKVLALKVIRDTIQGTVEGVGGNVQMGVVGGSYARLLAERDLRALDDAVDLWEARCRELLCGDAGRAARRVGPARPQTRRR
jgi:hypothetical protein